MMKLWHISILISGLFTFCFGSGCQAIAKELCPNVYLESEFKITLTTVEESLICDGKGGKDWRYIPLRQKSSFLKKFLANRGFYSPEFMEKNGQLTIRSGRRSYIDRVEIKNNLLNLDIDRFWRVFGQIMNSENLDKIESWVKSQYSQQSYPCFVISTKAFPDKNLVQLSLANLDRKRFGKIIDEEDSPFSRFARRRYDAFIEGEPFDSRLTALTSKRIAFSDLVIDHSFSVICDKESSYVDLRQKSVRSKPRLVSVGMGFDSDDLLFLEAGWRNSGLFDSFSNFQSRAYLSALRQHLSGEFNWYYAPLQTRHHLQTFAIAEHMKNANYESKSVDIRSGPVIDLDRQGYHISLFAGPSFEHSWISGAEGPRISNTFRSVSRTVFETHQLELDKDNPYTGHLFGLDLRYAQKKMGSDFTGTQWHLFGKYFYNILDLSPAIWVVGLRGGLVWFDYQKSDRQAIPANAYPRIGGSDTLRGFAYESLPAPGLNKAIYSGVEFRVKSIFSYGIEPYIFLDQARLSSEEETFGQHAYISPGMGVHWNSPLGAVRFYMSYPLITRTESDTSKEGVKFNINLGEDF